MSDDEQRASCAFPYWWFEDTTLAKTINDELEDWAVVDKALPHEDRGLLIGNGASIAMR